MKETIKDSFVDREVLTREFISDIQIDPFFMEMLDKIEVAIQYFDNKPECQYLLEQMEMDRFGDLQNKLFGIGLEEFVSGFMYFRSKVIRKNKELQNHPYYKMSEEQLTSKNFFDTDFIDHLEELQKAHELCMEVKRWLTIFTRYCLAGSYLITLILKKYPDLKYQIQENGSFLVIENMDKFIEKYRVKKEEKKDTE